MGHLKLTGFSKLESYGLVSSIPPPNLNLMAEYQNRYGLLRKGSPLSHFAAPRMDTHRVFSRIFIPFWKKL